MNYIKNYKKTLYLQIAIAVAIALYVSCFNPSVFTFRNNDHLIGYIDEGEHVRSLDDVLSGKVPYKDFYWQYGPFYIYLQLPAYVLFGRNYNALFMSQHTYLLFLSIIVSFIWAIILFNSGFLRLFFVIVCIFHNVNCIYPSIRHLIAELSLAMFILSLRKTDKKSFIFLAGLIGGSAILTSHEYGLSALITVAITTCLLYFITDNKTLIKQRFGYYFLGVGAVVLPYYLYLGLNGALINYFRFIYGVTAGFSNPAGGELFPVFPAISFENFSVFFKSFYDFFVSQNLRFYLPLVIYFASFIYFIVKFIRGRNEKILEIFVLSFYGLIIFGRILTGPSYGYLTYGFIPLISLSFLFLQYLQKASIDYYLNYKIAKAISVWIILAFVYIWIFLTIENKQVFNFAANLNLGKKISEHKQGRVYYDRVGYYVNPKTKEQYEMINAYIERYLDADEYLLVYPFGPYNHFTKRPSPLAVRDVYDFMAGSYFIDEAIRQLEQRRPRYIILNTFTSGIPTIVKKEKRKDTRDSIEWHDEDGPSFGGRGDKLQIYILENYRLQREFDYAAVMTRRDKRKSFKRNFSSVYLWRPEDKNIDYTMSELESIDNVNVFKLKGRNAYLEHRLDNIVLCSHAEITFRVKNDLLRRMFSKNIVSIDINSGPNSVSSVYRYDLQNYNKYQTAWVGFGGGRVLPVDSVKISIRTPKPYILSGAIEIMELRLLLEVFDDNPIPAEERNIPVN